MKKYGIDFKVYDDAGLIDLGTAFTKAESLEKAENNIAWRYVVNENDDAEWPGCIIEFESGRRIDGSKRNPKNVPLYIKLMHDLHKHECYVDEFCAFGLRQKFNVNKNNYATKLTEVIKYWQTLEEEKKSATEQKKEENIMDKKAKLNEFISKKSDEEKCIFDEIFRILQDSGCNIDYSIDKPGHAVLLYKEEGVIVTLNTAIEFGREVYKEIVGLVDEAVAKTVQSRLVKIFGNKKEEKKMENNYAEAMADAYADLAGMEPPISGMRIDFNILVKGKETATSRWITIKEGEIGKSEYFLGFVYNGRNNYVGCWQWKLAYRHPQFGPSGQKDLLGKQFWLGYGNGNSNVARLILAIEKALNAKGVKTKRKDRETWVIGVVPDTRRSVTGPTENVFPGSVNQEEDAI